MSTFAGCGGSILGYGQAGFDERLAVEFEPDAVRTLRRNFPGLTVYEGDICDLTADECMFLAGVKPGELDVLDGSPPCAGFSTSGRRKVSDQRSQLYEEFARLLEGMRPRAFVVENVPAMVGGRTQFIFVQMMERLRSCGYKAKAQILNSMWFGVPQRRRRLIVIGIRDDIDAEPSHPKPYSQPITFEEACGDLRGDSPDDRPLSALVKLVAKQMPREWTTPIPLYRRIKGGNVGGGRFNLVWADWNKVCGTLVSMEANIAGIVHPDRQRYISLAEARRLGGFPDDFEFTDRGLGIERIGNSVPPPLMRAIAAHIKGLIDGGKETDGEGQQAGAGQAQAKAQGAAADQASA